MLTDIEIFSNFSKNPNIFEGVYEIRVSKVIGIFISAINITFFSPAIYFMIWYEKFESNQPRSLVNQFVSSSCWSALIFIFFIQTGEIGIALKGSISSPLCYIHTLIKMTLTIQYSWQAISISVMKYLYIFVLKSPSGQFDDFWCFYINILIAILAILSQIIFLFTPGKNPYFYYMCTGEDPSHLGKTKINYIFQSSFVILFFVYSFVLLKKILFNSKTVVPTLSYQLTHQNQSLPSTIENVAKTMLASFGTLATTVFAVLPIMYSSLVLNATDTEKLSTFPYYDLIQFHLHVCPSIIASLLVISYYLSHRKLRLAAFREMKELFVQNFY
jgi:hypothetical protein